MLRIVSAHPAQRNGVDARGAITFSRHAIQGCAHDAAQSVASSERQARRPGLFFVKGLRGHARSVFRSSKKGCTCVSVKNAHIRKGVRHAA